MRWFIKPCYLGMHQGHRFSQLWHKTKLSDCYSTFLSHSVCQIAFLLCQRFRAGTQWLVDWDFRSGKYQGSRTLDFWMITPTPYNICRVLYKTATTTLDPLEPQLLPQRSTPCLSCRSSACSECSTCIMTTAWESPPPCPLLKVTVSSWVKACFDFLL